jgi:hypothetical protein
MKKLNIFVATIALTLGLGAGCSLWAQPFTPGTLTVVRVGNGTDTLTNNAAAVSLLEISITGTVLQTINVPSTGANALTLRGSSTTEGILLRSQNLNYLTFGGYRADHGATNPSGAGAAGQVPRVIGIINDFGTLNTSPAIGLGAGSGSDSSYWNDSFRAVATDDGTRFWTSGAAGTATNGGLRFVADTSSTTSLALSPTGGNTRTIRIENDQLFVSAGSANPGRSVFKIGDGLPTSGSPTFNFAFTPDASRQYQSFVFARLGNGSTWNPTGNEDTGYDTIYATDTNLGAFQKFSFDGTNWVTTDTIGSGGSIAGLEVSSIVAIQNGSTMTFFGTTSNTSTGRVWTFTDSSGFSAAMNGVFADLDTPVVAGTNFAFRGIAFSPVPEPTSLVLLGLAAGGVGYLTIGRRRGRKLDS